MLVYENNNKLNINFNNEVSENPDLQIGKEDGKTEVLIDGQSVGGGGGVLIVPVNITHEGEGVDSKTIFTLTKTYREIKNAGFAVFQIPIEDENRVVISTVDMFSENDGNFIITAVPYDEEYSTDSMDGYPSFEKGK